MKENLFSYGTLQRDNVQFKLFGRLLKGSTDILKGYKLSSIEITDESFISKGEEKFQLIAIPSNDKNDIIEGTLLEVSKLELLLADKYEPAQYTRVNVEFSSGKKGWIYAASEI
ncbi:MAG: gamma-glutamylcyclotransferase family protein [Bacteroidota bacterium]